MININNLPEQIDPVVARKYKEKQIQKEKYIFLVGRSPLPNGESNIK